MNIIGRPKIVKIVDIREETSNIKTLYFNYDATDIRPGQFLMIWDLREEIPLSVSYIGEKGLLGISIKGVGETTKHLISLGKDDQIGVRGPYGNSFNVISHGKALVIGGGIGIAPLMPLIKILISKPEVFTTCVIGAKNAYDIPFLEDLQIIQSKFFKLHICTDDGSMGFHGLISDFVSTLLVEEDFDKIYLCGPELMMKKIFDASRTKNIPIEASLERIMKCGIGICGQCVIDPMGLRVCKDGPIFNEKQLEKLTDFGVHKRGYDGSICDI
ncbi:MAG: dihydroorotate dehydrogenase electron transfer subunit [Candidatus Helarchaeota archaeon]